MHLGDRDRGHPSGLPGQSDKLWRTHWVDSELKDEWLERLNSIPGIEIWATCAGHSWEKATSRPGGPELILKTQDPDFVREFSRVLAGREPDQEIKFDGWGRKWVLSSIPKDPFLGVFPRKPYPYGLIQREGDDTIEIVALAHRNDMSRSQREEWWETLINVLETSSIF